MLWYWQNDIGYRKQIWNGNNPLWFPSVEIYRTEVTWISPNWSFHTPCVYLTYNGFITMQREQNQNFIYICLNNEIQI